MDDMFPGAHGKLNIELPEKSQKPQPKQGKDTRSYSSPQAESEPEVVGSVHHLWKAGARMAPLSFLRRKEMIKEKLFKSDNPWQG